MSIVRLASALCLVAVAVAGCGRPPGTAAGPAGGGVSVAKSVHADKVPAPAGPTPFGVRRSWASGLSITISVPKSLTPSGMAYPQAPRAALFEVTIDNGTTDPYRPTGLVIEATSDGRPIQQVQDSTQGLNGIMGATADVPPGKTLRLTLGFAVPVDHVPLRLSVQPDVGAPGGPAVYVGMV